MRRSSCFLLIVMFGSWLSSFGQSAPKLTSPRIVATFERVGQTGNVIPIKIYTPKKWGTFRISIVMVGTVAGGSGNWTGAVEFWDGAGRNGDIGTTFSVQLPSDTRQTSVAEFPIRALGGLPITFSVVGYGQPEGSKYNVWVVVEQLM